MRNETQRIRVCLFCGGRGSATLINELLRRPEVDLYLLVNAYDDGLSTGALRDFIPGMLGPSDFRKNLSYLLDLYSTQQYALRRLFEYRLPLNFSPDDLEALRQYVKGSKVEGRLQELANIFDSLAEPTKSRIRNLLTCFFDYLDSRGAIDFSDCSFGNLIFAGAYLNEKNSFNRASQVLTELVDSQARLLNVSAGEARTLVGLKADGEILTREASIVGKQSSEKIIELFFLDGTLSDADRHLIADFSVSQKKEWLKKRELVVRPSAEAVEALRGADVLVYGPGTQHSSLLPSYRILRDHILESPAPIKAFVSNLHQDHDIQGLKLTDLIDNALHYLNDPSNQKRGITHVLYNSASSKYDDGIKHEELKGSTQSDSRYGNIVIVHGKFENPIKATVHSGYAIVGRIIELFDEIKAGPGKNDIEIRLDLAGRTQGYESVLQELLEIDWKSRFRDVTLCIDATAPITLGEPAPNIHVRRVNQPHELGDVSMVRDWLSNSTSEYLVTMTGDGEYRLREILLGVDTLGHSRFGAVYGSRNQSRKQFHNSLRAAYGEGSLLFWTSWLGAFLVTALMSLRYGLILSDPLTGFRLYRRSRFPTGVERAVGARSSGTAIRMTKILIQNQVDIAEMPVSYRTFSGFTRPSWRFHRGLRNLMDILI